MDSYRDVRNILLGRDVRNNLLGRDVRNNLLGRDVQNNLLGRDVRNNFIARDVRNNFITRDVRNNLLDRDGRNNLLDRDGRNNLLGRDVRNNFIASVVRNGSKVRDSPTRLANVSASSKFRLSKRAISNKSKYRFETFVRNNFKTHSEYLLLIVAKYAIISLRPKIKNAQKSPQI